MNTVFSLFLLSTLISVLLYHGSDAAFQIPILLQRAPLYDSINLLIADERLNAQLVWNETAYHLTEASYVLEEALDQLSHYNPIERLKGLNAIVKDPNGRKCYLEYEREIAHFNREFIAKYHVCKQTLDIAATHLEDETFEEIDFIRNASLEIQRVGDLCKILDLKRQNQNHEGVLLCVIAHIGKIDQRLLESSQLILDIIAEITMNADIEDDNCHAYNELKEEFDATYFAITECIEELTV